MAPENDTLEKEIPIGNDPFLGRTVSLEECSFFLIDKSHVLTSATDLGWHFRNLPTIVTAGPSWLAQVGGLKRKERWLKIEVLGLASGPSNSDKF